LVSQKQKNIYRVPKVFQAPREEDKPIWPRLVLFVVLALLTILGLIYFLFFSKVFKIKIIDIVGNPNDEVRVKLDELKGKNIFSFHAKSLEHEIIQNNQNYLSVKVLRGIPDTVRIIFQNREPKIIWISQNQRYFVDNNAILFQKATDSAGLPEVIDTKDLAVAVPEKIATSKFVEFIRSVSEAVAANDIIVKNFEIKETTFQADAITNKGFRIIFDTMRPLSEQMEAFKLVYEKNKDNIKEYIDLRVEGKVFFK
jgi:cell division septal protein FtsQ